MSQFEPCTLKKGEEGDSLAFQAKLTGAGANDMCNMQELTKDTILSLLKDRFKKEIVYTYVGDIVVSVNPFKNTGCVGKSIRNRYKKGGAQNAQLLMPHIYHLVDQTFAQMMTEQKSQSILISGESGAGKTEAMKISLTYIGEISVQKDGKGGKNAGPDPTAGRLMSTNPIMEAIGNAKTVRNDNSSRFGKHFDMQFDEKGSILGAFTSTYLLEKPRIVEHMRGERNYHIFYMVAKADSSIRDPVGIKDWKNYRICSQAGTVAEVNSWNDNAEFRDMHAAYIKLGFSEQQRQELYFLLSICLHLGNVEFEDNDTEGSSITTPETLEVCAEMLQVPPEDLGAAITSRTMGGGVIEVFVKPLEARQAAMARNSLIMYVYGLMFDWCVDVVNDYIAVGSCDFAIGILDIFGFENFTLNSFPQLCINFTNESLHNLFIEHVFKLEQETYIREEVDWQFVEYEDNQPTIDLICKRPVCIYGLLDEGCGTGSGTDASVLSNFNGVFKDPKKHKSYLRPKKSADKCFIVAHYAGEVTYDITGFVDKNKDELSQDIEDITLVHTKFEQLQQLAKRDAEKKADLEAAKAASSKKNKGGGKKKKTVARVFGDSLAALMQKLRSTEPHYIRCLKPNQTLKAGDWDSDFMFKQLSYSGTLEVTEIRKAGLNVRRPLAHFYRYYKICADDQDSLRAGTVTKRCINLLEQLGIDENKWRVGKTLVFLKDYEIMEQLDKIREEKIVEYVIMLQSYFRMSKDLQYFRRFRKYVQRIQGFIKTQVIREAFEEVCQATRVVQKYARRRIYQNAYKQVMDECRPKEIAEEIDFPKAREAMHKQLIKLNPNLNFFAPAAKRREGNAGKSTRRRSGKAKGGAKGGDDAADDPTMPRFRCRFKCWVTARYGKQSNVACLAYMRLGVLTLFKDESLTRPILSVTLADLRIGDDGISSLNLLAKLPPSLTELSNKKKKDKGKKPEAKAKAAEAKAADGGEGGTDDALKSKEAEGALSPVLTLSEEIVLTAGTPPDGGSGSEISPGDVISTLKKHLEEGIAEAKTLDADLQLNFNLGSNSEEKPEELAVVTEGYLHTKMLQLEEGTPADARTIAKAWDAHKEGWARVYYVLLNNGKLKYYESAQMAAQPEAKRIEMGELHLRLFAVADVEETPILDTKAQKAEEERVRAKKAKESAKEGGSGSKPTKKKPVEMKIEGEFYSLVKGKQFDLRSGRFVFRLASGIPAIAEEWLNTLTAAVTTMYQKSPIYPQNQVLVTLMSGEQSRQLINESTTCAQLVKRMCKDKSVNNPEEWGIYEVWSWPDIPGMPGLSERKLPPTETLLDQTMLKWEVATRARYGMIAAMPDNAFKLVLRKATSLVSSTRSKEELAMEYDQACVDYLEGHFCIDNDDGEPVQPGEDSEEVWDLAAWCAFKEAFDKRLRDAHAEEEVVAALQGGLNAERLREIQRTLEHSIEELDPQELEKKETQFLPKAWFDAGSEAKLPTWRKKICDRFKTLLVDEILDEGEAMRLTARLMYEYRMESEPNSYAIMNLFVDRVRRAPKCFAMQFMASIWTQEHSHPVVLQLNYIGLHIYTTSAGNLNLLASFYFTDSLVSWLALYDMLTLHVVRSKTRQSAKLHFLTREAQQIKTNLSRYSEAVLQELQKNDKEKANRKKLTDRSGGSLLA